jgi:sialate O-acetylesterase
VQKKTSDKPLTDVQGKWQASTAEVAPGFSAVGWYFGRELRKKLNVPVGVINTSWGGTPAEAWASNPALTADADFKPMLDNWEKRIADHPAAMERYNTVTLPKWEEDRKKAKEEGKPEPQRPRAPEGATSQNRPANLYNAMIAPLVPYSARGAIWYQGESNAGRAYQYRKLLPAMIADWRRAWNAQKPEDFGFYIVQLANFMAEKPQPGESNWAELREAQTMTANMPGNGQALAIDIGEEKDIHPRNKRDVGLRLAAAALAQTYGQKIPYSGPAYDTMTTDGNRIRLKFKHTAGGLVNKNADANVLPGFAIAGADKKWVWANAKLEGNEIVVWSDEITAPVAVRYAWADNPKATLYNGAGFPAVPFRTDDWPGVTVNNK